MTAQHFLDVFRGMGGDAFRVGDRVTLDGPPALLDAVRWRLLEIGKPALMDALQREESAANERLVARRHGICA